MLWKYWKKKRKSHTWPIDRNFKNVILHPFVNFHCEVGLHDKFHQMMNVIDKWYLWQKWYQGYTYICYLFKLFHACSQAPMLGDFIDISTWTCLKINFYAPTDDLSTFCFWEHGTIVFNFTFINLRLNKPWKDFCNMCQNISSSGVTEIYLSLFVSTITCIELNPNIS